MERGPAASPFRKGRAKVRLRDNKGRVVETMLMGSLYIPSFPQDIFSVKAATSQGAKVIFKEGRNRLVHKNGVTFDIMYMITICYSA